MERLGDSVAVWNGSKGCSGWKNCFACDKDSEPWIAWAAKRDSILPRRQPKLREFALKCVGILLALENTNAVVVAHGNDVLIKKITRL